MTCSRCGGPHSTEECPLTIHSKVATATTFGANWVVIMQTMEAKKHFKSQGVATEGEARALASQWRNDLLLSGKDRWYEVIIKPPTEEHSSPVTVEEMRRALYTMENRIGYMMPESRETKMFEAAMYAAKTTMKDATERRVFVQDFAASLNRRGLLINENVDDFTKFGYIYMEASEHSSSSSATLKPIIWHGTEYFAYGSLARPLEWLTIKAVIKSVPHPALTRLSRSIDYGSAEPYFNIILSPRQFSAEEIKALELTPLEKLATATSSNSFHVKYIDLTTGKTLEKTIPDREQHDLYKLQREGKISIIDIHKVSD